MIITLGRTIALSCAVLATSVPARRCAAQAWGVVHLKHTTQSGTRSPLRAVVWDSATFRTLWERARTPGLTDATPPPLVDFTRYMVIVVAMGFRPTIGNDIEVESVDSAQGGVLRIIVAMTSPGADCVAGAMAEYPIDIVQLPQAWRARATVFVEEHRFRSCKN